MNRRSRDAPPSRGRRGGLLPAPALRARTAQRPLPPRRPARARPPPRAWGGASRAGGAALPWRRRRRRAGPQGRLTGTARAAGAAAASWGRGCRPRWRPWRGACRTWARRPSGGSSKVGPGRGLPSARSRGALPRCSPPPGAGAGGALVAPPPRDGRDFPARPDGQAPRSWKKPRILSGRRGWPVGLQLSRDASRCFSLQEAKAEG